MQNKLAHGFTLIELIITVAIIAILVAVLTVALNPAEQLARSRDAKRVSDLDSLRSAIAVYGATATTTINLSGDTAGSEDARCIGGTATTTKWVNTTGGVATSGVFVALSATTTQAVGAAGWLPMRLDEMPGGSPLSVRPLDPSNGTGGGTTFYYAFGCKKSGNTYETTARLESTYFKTDLNRPGTDGGNSITTYEVGTDLTIIPSGE